MKNHFSSFDNLIYRSLWIFVILLCFTACKKKQPKLVFNLETPGSEVVSYHDENTPQLVYFYKTDKNGNKTQEKIGVAEFFPNKQERLGGALKNGKEEGKWYVFYQDGTVQTEVSYMDGIQHGVYNLYREDGKPLIKGHYDHGNCDGTWYWYDTNGKQIKKIKADANTVACEYCPKCLALKKN